VADSIGQVRPLGHEGCGEECRELCFEVRDPKGRLVRLTHGTWLSTVAKLNRSQMADRLADVKRAISDPRLIQRDSDDARGLMYYVEPSDWRGKLLLVAVKCLPRRFQDGESQRRYARIARIRVSYGEAWVASAYPVMEPKRRGVVEWQS
jgi:hypothetical protein